MSHIWGKLLLGLVILIFAIGYTIVRIIRNRNAKNYTKNLVNKILNSYFFTQDFIHELNNPYSFQIYSEHFSFASFIKILEQEKVIDNYEIALVHRIDSNKYLIVTECKDSDFDITLTGKMGNVDRSHNLNFLVIHDPVRKQVKVSSDHYENNYMRGLRHSFARKILQLVK